MKRTDFKMEYSSPKVTVVTLSTMTCLMQASVADTADTYEKFVKEDWSERTDFWN